MYVCHQLDSLLYHVCVSSVEVVVVSCMCVISWTRCCIMYVCHQLVSLLQASADDCWYHVVWVYDGQCLMMYLDGQLKETIPISGKITTSYS